jgi:hypothetical protein
VKCTECGGRVDSGRCLSCYSDAGCCTECGGPVNHRGRCLDCTCRRFGLLPDQEERHVSRQHEEQAAEARAWYEYYRAVGNVTIVHEYDP